MGFGLEARIQPELSLGLGLKAIKKPGLSLEHGLKAKIKPGLSLGLGLEAIIKPGRSYIILDAELAHLPLFLLLTVSQIKCPRIPKQGSYINSPEAEEFSSNSGTLKSTSSQ